MRRVAACVPAPAVPSGYENPSATLDNLPNWPRIVTSRTHRVQGSEQVLSGHNGEHPEPEIEDVLHLVVGHAAGSLDLGEDARHLPLGAVDVGVAVAGEHALEV